MVQETIEQGALAREARPARSPLDRDLANGAAVPAADFPPERILMVPGPSNLHPRVARALAAPIASHKDPAVLAIMDEIVEHLRRVFVTRNRATFVLPASGGSGMDAALLNLVEPGDTVVVGRAGFFAHRMVGIAERLGARVVVVDAPWGQALDPRALVQAVRQHGARVLATVHGETSTGVEHPLHGLGAACTEAGAFLVVDAVASWAGTPLPVDELQIDVCYSGSQKCLSAPPGMAPITLSDRALEHIQRRSTPVPSWYLDLALHARYWSAEHIYHHTGPVLNLYALCEALRLVQEEGLEARYERHRRHARALRAGIEALGLRLFADPAHRLANVTTVEVPPGVGEQAVRGELLRAYSLEIAGGLDQYAGRLWRIGIMGHSAQRRNVLLVLSGLAAALGRHGFPTDAGAALRASAELEDTPAFAALA